MAKETFVARARKHGIACDGLLVNGAGLGDSELFRLDRLPEIRAIINGTPEVKL